MRTYKPISSITYCEEQYVDNLLRRLKTDEIISFGMACRHKGFDGKKDHIHVYVEPVDTIDTGSKTWRLMWEQSTGEEVLGTMPWMKSKFRDWYLYSRHDRRYLEIKRCEKKKEYDLPLDRFFGTEGWEARAEDVDIFDLLSPIEKIMSCIDDQLDVYKAMKVCRIPYGAMIGFRKIYEDVRLSTQTQFEARYSLKYFPCPEDVGLTEHVYYRDNISGMLITADDYKKIRGKNGGKK